MKVKRKPLSIQIGARDTVLGTSASLIEKHQPTAIVVAHGVDTNMNTLLITSFSNGIAASGFPVLHFNFLYNEHGQKVPDKHGTLRQAWPAALDCAKTELGDTIDIWIAAGNFMNGRVAPPMVANNTLPIRGLIFLGYLLHPAKSCESPLRAYGIRCLDSNTRVNTTGTRKPKPHRGPRFEAWVNAFVIHT